MLRQFDSLRIGEIAAHEVISQPRATKIVADLESQGLVARAADPDDGRASVITITDAGREAIDRRLAQLATLLEPRFESLSAADWSALARTVELLEAALDDPPGAQHPHRPSHDNPQGPDAA